MACKPETWEFYQDKVAEELGYGKDTLRKYLDELIVHGWLTEKEQQKNDGKFGCLEYIIEVKRKKGNLPIREKTDTEKTRIGKNHNQKDIDNNSSTINSPTIKDIDKKRLSNDNQKDELFEKFWSDYGRKGAKARALKEWNRLKDKEKQLVMKNLPDYLIYCKRKQREMKDASSYLHQEYYAQDWNIIPDYYKVYDTDLDRIRRFKEYMVSKFPDLIYHRNPLTFEQGDRLMEEYGAAPFEEAMRRLCGRDIHQYYSIKSGVETILKEMQNDDV